MHLTSLTPTPPHSRWGRLYPMSSTALEAHPLFAALVLSIVLMFDPCAPGGEAPNLACFSTDRETVARLHIESVFPPDQVDTAMAVAWCESRWVVDARNPSSSATGLFQHLAGWYEGRWGTHGAFDPTDPYESALAARYLWESDGWMAHWYPSSGCWN